MWRICTKCGSRSDGFVCDNDGTETEVIRADTEFPGRLRKGDVLLDHYEVGDLVGVGGMGAVYRGEQRLTRQSVAIKVLWPDLAADPVEVKRFSREARAASLLAHPNSVRVFDFGSDPRTKALFIIMEFLAGQKLSDVLRGTPVLDPVRAVHVAAQVCKALEEAHRRGVIHRDIKPDNIFLQEVAGERDFAKILDFGLAKFISGEFERDGLTRAGYVVGSPEYMAPEQASGGEVGPAADIYSLGVVLYECLTGRLPFDAQTTAEVLRKHILEGPPAMTPEEGDLPVPEALQEVVLRCLEKDPAARPVTADALRIQLLQACDRRRQNGPRGDAGSVGGAATGTPSSPHAPTAIDYDGGETNAEATNAEAAAAAAPTWRMGKDGRTTVPNPVVDAGDFSFDKTPRDPIAAMLAKMDTARTVAGAEGEPQLARPIAPTAVPTAQIAQLGLLGPDVGRDSPPLADALDPVGIDIADRHARPGSVGVRPTAVLAPAATGPRWLVVGLILVAVVLLTLAALQLRS